MSKIENFIAWLKEQVGSIYVWGAQGETATESLIRNMETSRTNINRALKLYKKRVAEGTAPKMYDCSGLIVCFFLSNNLIDSDTNASGLYSKCKGIKQSDLKAGDLVFHHNGTKIHHVGVYIGDNTVIHAKGRDVGVVKEKFSANDWNRFGRYDKLQEQESEEIKMVELKITNPLTKSDAICELQEALNRLGYDCGEPDGICGKNTMKAIQQFADRHTTVKLPDGATVNVKVGDITYAGTLRIK